MTPSTLLHPLKLDVVGFQEEQHDYQSRNRAGSLRLKAWGA